MSYNSFTFNGISSDTYKVTVESCPSYPVAQRIVEHIQIPGRNGDLIRDTGAYGNVEQTYSIYFDGRSSSFQDAARDVANWLNGSFDYCRLEDTYDPTVYRMAVMSNYTEYRNFRNRLGRADVTFSCKPQRFLKSGETLTAVTGNTLQNNYMDCYPIYAVTGNGDVTVNGYTFTVANNAGDTVYIDSETQDCWSGDLTRKDVQLFDTVNLSTLDPTGGIRIRIPQSGLSNLYLNYNMSSPFGSTSGTLKIPLSSSFTQTVTAWTTSVKFSHTPGFVFIDVELTAGTSASISGSLSTDLNRNGDVTGDIVGVPSGGCSVAKTVSALSWIPNWWTL